MKRFPGGLVFKAHRLLYHSTLGSRVIKKKKGGECDQGRDEGNARARQAKLHLQPPAPHSLQRSESTIFRDSPPHHIRVSQKKFIKSFCTSQFPHKSVNIFFIVID